jgi:hypothetical protein
MRSSAGALGAASSTTTREEQMRRMTRAMVAAGMLLVSGGCAMMPLSTRFSFRPACSPMQARAYRTTSIMQTRQRVSQIQARYSFSGRAMQMGSTSSALASGECR